MDREKGWIKLHRKMLDNPIVCKDVDHLAVWVYLLLKATHKDIEKLFGKDIITLKPGQLITGRKKIASQLNISESKVNRIIKRLKNEQLIEQQVNNKGSLVTIRNWELYQNDTEQQNEQQVNNKWTASEQQVNTNKNIRNKEYKNNNNIITSHKFEKGSVELETTKRMIAILLKAKPDAKKPNEQSWAKEVDKILRIDGRTSEQIVWLFNWAQNNDFWVAHVRSPRKLREKWDTLEIQATRGRKKTSREVDADERDKNIDEVFDAFEQA